MDLEELKRIRKANIIAHKKKKRAYYLKRKQANTQRKTLNLKVIDYENELFSGNFIDKIKEIAKKQKLYVDNRQEAISIKIEEYRKKKQRYYEENKKNRLKYDKEYREKKKKDLQAYRKAYYQKNREKILARQKLLRELKKQNDN